MGTCVECTDSNALGGKDCSLGPTSVMRFWSLWTSGTSVYRHFLGGSACRSGWMSGTGTRSRLWRIHNRKPLSCPTGWYVLELDDMLVRTYTPMSGGVLVQLLVYVFGRLHSWNSRLNRKLSMSSFLRIPSPQIRNKRVGIRISNSPHNISSSQRKQPWGYRTDADIWSVRRLGYSVTEALATRSRMTD